MPLAAISSPDNPLVRRLAALQQPRAARAEGVVLVEGRRAIDGCIATGWVPERVLVREGEPVPPGWPAELVQPVSARIAERLSQASTASGYLGVFPRPTPPPLDPAAGGLVLAGVQDPGNVGTLVRTAAALAQRQVVVAGGCDPFGHKALQASAGALPLVACHLLDGPGPLAGGAPCCALVVRDGRPPEALPPGPRWVVVGGEADGVPPAWLAACAERLTLPMPGGTESLNAAVAGSLALYALWRGR